MTRFLALIVIGSGLGLSSAAEGDKKLSYLDLQPYANQKLSDNLGRGTEGNNLAALRKEEQTLQGVKFKIADGFIQLGSTLLKDERPNKVEGIKVGKAFAKLHLLHATGYGNGSVPGEPGKDGDPLFVADDTQIGEYKVRFADGSTEAIPVVYGKDVRDWWFTEASKDVTRGKVAWKGDNEFSKLFKSQIRLYITTWENPHPTKPVATIDYIKVGDGPAAPFCVAATLEEK
jgi:hypothetical protein